MSAPTPRVAAAVDRADAAVRQLQLTLISRLKEELGRGGPKAAVTVCRDEAQQLTDSVGKAQDLAIGRTSHKIRNPRNAPRAWAAGTVASSAGRPITGARPAVFDLGDRVGVLRPIGQMAMCETCHGPREQVEAAIGDVLRTSYPDDQAVGFAAGDLRGWFWVEVLLAPR
ncbi:MAG: DUF3365 domain-containing protein [Acidobacteria bacterium]|nr:DUF3365 domain-containing protein [Acidobacteriota bacterium]